MLSLRGKNSSGRWRAQVRAKDVNHGQVVELITAGRSGDLGLRLDEAAVAGAGETPV
jgi:D-xylose transport system ATP-binding protein